MTDLKAIPDPASLQSLLAELPANLLAGRRVLVTGGARGLGLAFAQCIAAAGASVVLADILGELAETEAKALRDAGRTAHALPVDLSNPEAVVACADEAIRLLGGLDGLVNNAAITNSGGRDAHQLEVDMWDRVMNVNVRGSWLMGRACRAALAASGRGAIVNLASDTALWGAPNLLAYASSKGRRHFHDALAGARMGRRQHHRQRRGAGPHAGRGDRIRAHGAPPEVPRRPRHSARTAGRRRVRRHAVHAVGPCALRHGPAAGRERRLRDALRQPNNFSDQGVNPMSDLSEQQKISDAPATTLAQPEGSSLADWMNSRIARYDTRKYDWDALKFQSDFDPKYRRAQMRYVGTGGTGVAKRRQHRARRALHLLQHGDPRRA
jgi:NAD(P)-dependent dehydrogenase (short-subunit alcohol dehydrogenase family)